MLDWNEIEQRIERIEGLLIPGYIQEKWLFETAQDLPDGASILEIGSYKGRSTCCLGFGCLGTNKHVYSIDTFCGNDTDFIRDHSFYEEWLLSIASCGLLDYITPLTGFSSAFYGKWTKPIHLLFMDGSHQQRDVINDFEAFFPHVVSGGIVSLHDVTEGWPGPYEAWHRHISSHLRCVAYCRSIGFGLKP